MVQDQSRQPETLLIQYWHVLKKRQLIIGSFTGLLLITVIIATAMSTRYYSAAAVVEISPRAPQVFEVEQVSEMGTTSSPAELRAYYGTQYRILQSRKVMERSIQKLEEDYGIIDFESVEKPESFLRGHLRLSPQAETNLVHVAIEYPDADKAALFANVIADVYREQNLQKAQDAASDALMWLQEQKGDYEERKQTSDRSVHEFKRENGLLGFDERYNTTLESLAEVQSAWNEAHTRRIATEAEYRELARKEGSSSWEQLITHLALTDNILNDMQSHYVGLEQEDIRLSVRYLAQHPERVRINTEMDGVRQQIRGRVNELVSGRRSEVDVITRRESALKERLDTLEAEVEALDERRIELQFLKGAAERDEELYKSLDRRMSEVDLSKLVQANNVQVIDAAVPGDKPVRPNMPVNIAMALFMGLLGGAALSFLAEYLDSTVKSRDDLERIVGIPMLGYVPLIDPAEMEALTSNRDRSIFVNARPRSAVAECLRSIRTNIMFRTQQRAGHLPFRTLLVTSAAPREGKSFMSSNLATIIAMTGSRVLLIDADLRRPNVHRLFELSDEKGLSDVLSGHRSLESVIIPSHVSGLDLVVAGPIPPNPSELLGNERMQNIKSMIRGYDVVIIDTPPVTVVADPMVLTPLADGVLVVVESNRTSKSMVTQAVSRLEQVSSRILGAVVNKLDVQKTGYGYSYYYEDYGYYSEEEYEEQTRKLG
ncbi:MAG: polysaccharide biosynthesis tyrosine autokinase [Myxococcota bacterium]|nr:polysaccharide biosynthesis tyrosine autokinase [Myxococcota bacterium]